jgi:hypothetical protein
MLSPYLRKIDTSSLSNRINLKVNISDTSTMLSKYLRKTDTANKWVNNITRTLGKDSIIYYIGNTRYAIKDSVGTNPPASGYYGAFQDNTTQSALSINTAYPVKFNTTDLTNGVSIVNDGSSNPTKITLSNTGIYNIQFSLQLEKTGGSGNMIADIWVRKNGVDIPSTTGKVVLTGSANASPIIAAWNYVLDLAAGDYIQLMWATSNTNIEIVAAGATSPHPAIPSSILTVTQQSGIMAGTGITAINSLTGAAQTMVTGTDSSDFKIVSTGTSHKFNLPTASATNRGLLSSANWSTFNGKIGASDTATMLANYQLKTPTIAYLSGDFNTTNTTATNTNLTIAVEANTAYRIMISGSASKATSSTGMKISIGAPTGTTIKATASLGSNAISTIVNSFITSINSLGSTFATGVGVEVPFRVEGILVTGANAGSITLQGATVTSNTATIYANTLMTLTKAYAQ